MLSAVERGFSLNMQLTTASSGRVAAVFKIVSTQRTVSKVKVLVWLYFHLVMTFHKYFCLISISHNYALLE